MSLTVSLLLATLAAAVPPAGPAPRHGVAMAYDRATDRVLQFGGVNHLMKPYVRYGDTWAWDGHGWVGLSRIGPAPRIWPAMAWDGPNGRLLLFGGFDSNRLLNDSWHWDGGQWLPVHPAHAPAARWHFAMAYDEARRRVVLFGGVNHIGTMTAYSETWIWDGTDWKQAADQGPGPRFGHAMAYDPSRRKVVLFGGRDTDQKPLGDTWDGTVWRGASFASRVRAPWCFTAWRSTGAARSFSLAAGTRANRRAGICRMCGS